MTKYVKEEYIRKYADKDIVEALDKSIHDHLEYAIGCHKAFMGEDPTDKEMEELEKNAHDCAMCWLEHNFYLQYNFDKDDHEYDHKMQMRDNYNKLVNSMTKEEIKCEDDIFEESLKKWDEFFKSIDIDMSGLKTE